jgi:hypothetical protein
MQTAPDALHDGTCSIISCTADSTMYSDLIVEEAFEALNLRQKPYPASFRYCSAEQSCMACLAVATRAASRLAAHIGLGCACRTCASLQVLTHTMQHHKVPLELLHQQHCRTAPSTACTWSMRVLNSAGRSYT